MVQPGPLLPYVFSCFRFLPSGPFEPPSVREDLRDHGAREAFAAELSADLVTPSLNDQTLLLGRIEEKDGFGVTAEQLGMNQWTVHRRWVRLRAGLRQIAAQSLRRTPLISSRPGGSTWRN